MYQGVSWFNCCTEAVSRGDLQVLKWLRELDPPCEWDEFTCLEAVITGNLEILIWLRSQKPLCPWDIDRCIKEARNYPYILDFIIQKDYVYFSSACTICLEDYEESYKLKALICGHAFHIDCVNTWLLKSKKCPYCKTLIS